MVDHLIERVSNMKITAGEEAVVELGEIQETVIDMMISLALVGRVVTVRPV